MSDTVDAIPSPGFEPRPVEQGKTHRRQAAAATEACLVHSDQASRSRVGCATW
jgi:hypothetical protein